MMKKHLLFAICLATFSLSGLCQYTSLPNKSFSDRKKMFVFADCGYFFGGFFEKYLYSDVDTRNSLDYSLGFGFKYGNDNEIFVSYTYANPTMFISDTVNNRGSVTLRSDFHLFQLGTIDYYELGWFRPFYEASFGGTYMTTRYLSGGARSGNASHDFDSKKWMFSATVGIGAKFDISERIGVKLQGRLIAPMSFNGLSIGLGVTGIYPYIHTNSYVLMLQGDASLGVYYKF